MIKTGSNYKETIKNRTKIFNIKTIIFAYSSQKVSKTFRSMINKPILNFYDIIITEIRVLTK